MSYAVVPTSSENTPTGRQPLASLNLLGLSLSSLSSHLRMCSGPGTGKSRALALLVWQYLYLGIPFVVFDITGAITANLIDKISRCSPAVQEILWDGFKYVARGVRFGIDDFVVPTPFYFRRRSHDTLFEIANRLPEVILRLDPNLSSAAIMGENALLQCSRYAGEIAAALHLQIPEAADLARHPWQWKEPLRRALEAFPELAQAVAYFRQLMDPKATNQRYQQTGSFLVKMQPFEDDPILKATFGASRRGIDYDKTLGNRQGIIFDYSGEPDEARVRFQLVWDFLDLFAYIRQRGLAGHDEPFLLVIDELVALMGPRTEKASVLANDLEQLFSVWARNAGCQLAVSHQNVSQLEERVQHVLTQMGTQVVGNVPNFEDALHLARNLHSYNPSLLKKREPVWMNVKDGIGPVAESRPTIIDHRTTEFSPDEQFLLLVNRIRRLPRFHYLTRPAMGEGNLTGQLRQVSFDRLDAGMYPDKDIVADARQQLRKRDGISVAALLAEIEQRRQEAISVVPMKAKNENGILQGDNSHAHPLPASKRTKTQRRTKPDAPPRPTGSASEVTAWQSELWTQSEREET